MRNLKKFLALVLAMMMVFSLMVTVNAAALSDYGDSNTVDAKYQEAVDVLSQLGIFRGTGGNFNPRQILSRAQVSTLIYRVIMGDVEDEQVDIYKNYGKFSDVGDDHWASGYINYAHNGKYVYGDGTGKFNPEDPITGYQLLAILLRAIGYGQNGEYQGNGWDLRSAADASELGITKGINSALLREPISREVVAQIIYNAIGVTMVRYTTGLGYLPLNISGTVDTTGVGLITLTEYADYDDWGAPVIEIEAIWNKVRGHVGEATLEVEPVATYTDAVLQCDVTDDVNGGKDFYATVYTNGRFDINNGTSKTAVRNYTNTSVGNVSTRNEQENVKVTAANTDPKQAVGANGRLTRVFENPLYDSRFKETDELYWDSAKEDYTTTATNNVRVGYNSKFIIVRIDSLLAKVTKVTKINRDTADHIERPSQLTLKVFDRNTTSTSGINGTNYTTVVVDNPVKEENWTYSVGDFLIVCAYQSNGGDVGFVVNENALHRGRVYTKTGGVNWPNGTNSVQHVEVYDLAPSVGGAQAVIYKNQHKHDVNGTPIPDNYRYHLDEAGNSTKAYTWYKDPYGNLLGSVETEDTYDYGVITQLWWADNANNGKGEARANITYVDGQKSPSYVVVASVNGWDTAQGEADHAGEIIGNKYRVANYDYNNENNGLVNSRMVQISNNTVDGTVDVYTSLRTFTTVNKNVSATTKIGENNVVYFNANSKYLVRVSDGKGGWDFQPKSGFPGADYKEVYVDYKNDATGYLAFGVIYAQKEAATNNPAVLAYVNSASYEIHNGNKVTEVNTRASGDLSGDKYYLLTGLLVNGAETPLKTQSIDVVKELTKNIGGLFYVTFSGDCINDFCQIGPDWDHNAVYYADIYVNGYALTDQEKPGDSARVINATDATQVVVEEEIFDWDAVDLNNLADQSVYVITNDAGTIASRIYVINDSTIDSNVKATLDALKGTKAGFNCLPDGELDKRHNGETKDETADPAIPSVKELEGYVKTGDVTKTVTVNGVTNGTNIAYNTSYVSTGTNTVKYVVPYSVWKTIAGNTLTVQVVDKDGVGIKNDLEYIKSNVKVPALNGTGDVSETVKITGTKPVDKDATPKVYKVANFTIEIEFEAVGTTAVLTEASVGDLTNFDEYKGKAVSVRDLMSLLKEKNHGFVDDWHFYSAVGDVTKVTPENTSLSGLLYATVKVTSEDEKTVKLWVIRFGNYVPTEKDVYGTLTDKDNSTVEDITLAVERAVWQGYTETVDEAVTALKAQGITDIDKIVPALAEVFGSEAHGGSAAEVIEKLLSNSDLVSGTPVQKLTNGFAVANAYMKWVAEAAAAEKEAAEAATLSLANYGVVALESTPTDAPAEATGGEPETDIPAYGIGADSLTLKWNGSGSYEISVTSLGNMADLTNHNKFGLVKMLEMLTSLAQAADTAAATAANTTTQGYPKWTVDYATKDGAKTGEDVAANLVTILGNLKINELFTKKAYTYYKVNIQLGATEKITFSITNNITTPAT